MLASEHDVLNQVAATEPAGIYRIARLLLRIASLAFACFIAVLYVFVCFGPVLGKVGYFKYHFSNPFKLLAVTIISLQVWWLLTPRASHILRRVSNFTWWQMKFTIEAIELGIVAIVGTLATDLGWQSASVIVLMKPAIAMSLALLAAIIVILTTRQRWRRLWILLERCRDLWSVWGWRARFIAIALLIHLALVSNAVLGYWQQTSRQFSSHEVNQSTVLSYTGKILCNFDYFCRACTAKIPPDARILYHGGNEGLILAFELYPRRVFMLPQEQREMFHHCWQKELWCRGMAADPLDECWQWDPPALDVAEPEFIDEHGITYVVMFDCLNASNCRIQAVR